MSSSYLMFNDERDDDELIAQVDISEHAASQARLASEPQLNVEWSETLPRIANYTGTNTGRIELPAFLDFEVNKQAAIDAAAAAEKKGALVDVDIDESETATEISTQLSKETQAIVSRQMASLSAPPVVISEDDDEKNRKYGTIDGVFIRVVVSIFGVMMFLRMGWMAAQAGLLLAIALVLMSVYITITTTFSVTALCTNGKVLGGGPYYIVSRSVGIEFGTAIGILISFAMMIAIALNTVGFAEEVVKLYSNYITGSREWDTVMIALFANGTIFAASLGGVGWVNHINLALFLCIMFGFFTFLVGTTYRPYNFFEGYTGYSSETFSSNMSPNFSDGVDFFVVIGVFFPSVTGILGGVALSGELKDPGRNISVGTLGAILFTAVVYILILILNAATGTPEVLKDYTTRSFMVEVSFWPPFVYAGIFSATLSTALGLLISAPRVLAATLKDGMFPKKLDFFAKLTSSGDPHRGYILSIAVASLVIILSGGKLNAIAPAVTVMYTAIYGIINYSCFITSIGRSPGWRPQFKAYNKWHALSGVFGCVVFMFLTNYIAAIIVSLFSFVLYKYAEFRKSSLNLGDAHESFAYINAMKALWTLESQTKVHVKHYRPSFLVLTNLCQDPDSVLKMAAMFYKARGVIVQGTVVAGDFTLAKLTELKQLPPSITVTNRAKAFHNSLIAPTLRQGMLSLIQSSGIGKVKTNITAVEFLEDFRRTDRAILTDYFEVVKDSMRLEQGTVVVRGAKNLFESYSATTRFEGTIDVYWLSDEGGLNMLLPYLLSRNFQWRNCKLRAFIPAQDNSSSASTVEDLKKLLKSFRIEAECHVVRKGDASSLPSTSSNSVDAASAISSSSSSSHYYLQYAADIAQKSKDATVVFVTLPLPFPDTTPLDYLDWLDKLSFGNKRTVFVRGSHSNVLTPFL